MAFVQGTKNADIINALDGVTSDGDTIWGLDGEDTIFGLGGNDIIKGGGGADNIFGGAGIDTAVYIDSPAGIGASLVSGHGGGGTGEVDTLNSIENLTGSNHNDSLEGNNGNNVLTGMNGDDSLEGRGGADVLDGGAGLDSITYQLSLSGVMVSLILNDAAGGEAEGDTFVSIENIDGSLLDDIIGGSNDENFIRGFDGDDVLKGFGSDDDLRGGDHNDQLFGHDGNDTLDGGDGIDTMEGGTGDDTYQVTHLDDVVVEHAGEGIDIVLSSNSYVLAEGVDVETLTAIGIVNTQDITLVGNSTNNVVIGNSGDNALKGGGGSDELIGNNGHDTLNGGAGVDVMTGGVGEDSFLFDTALNAVTNVDVITDFSVADDTIRLDNAVFVGLPAGALAANRFVIGTAAQDADDRIIYNSMTGDLLFDSDGIGGLAAIRFADLSPGLALTHNDFLIV